MSTTGSNLAEQVLECRVRMAGRVWLMCIAIAVSMSPVGELETVRAAAV